MQREIGVGDASHSHLLGKALLGRLKLVCVLAMYGGQFLVAESVVGFA